MLRLDFSLSICSGTTSACTEPKNASVLQTDHPWHLPAETRPMDSGKSNNRNARENPFLIIFFSFGFFSHYTPFMLIYVHLCR